MGVLLRPWVKTYADYEIKKGYKGLRYGLYCDLHVEE